MKDLQELLEEMELKRFLNHRLILKVNTFTLIFSERHE